MNSENTKNNKVIQDTSANDEPKILNGNYILGACLLASTTGDIYAAWDTATGGNHTDDVTAQFFIKFLPESYPRSDSSMQIFMEEIQHLRDCCDWCKVMSFGHEGDDVYLVLQLPRGQFLSHQLSTKKIYGGLADVLPLLSHINTALKTLEKCDMHHGRVEPESIFIDEKGAVGFLDSIYVSAKQHQLEQGVDYTSTVPNREAIYASPDVCFGRNVSEQDDVFSLACLSYYLLSGNHPFSGKNSVSALLNKMRPERIDTLTNAQWQHLSLGMHLVKESRLETVSDLINGFDNNSLPTKKKVKQSSIKKLKTKNSILKTNNKPSSFETIKKISFSRWAWIPLSLLAGLVVGVTAMSLSISLLGVDFCSLLPALKNSL
jgi:serine/threonine protein kinase